MALPVLLRGSSSPAFTRGLIQSLIPAESGLSSLWIEFAQSQAGADPAVLCMSRTSADPPGIAPRRNEPAPLPASPPGVPGSPDL